VNGPAVALKAAKAAIDGGLDADLNTGLKLETSLFTALWATEDQANGMRSFIENGPGKATFEGK
jgi:enoyl-CoA hydratase